MYSFDSVTNRYCEQCTQCGQQLKTNQVTVTETGATTLTGAALVQSYMDLWQGTFSCCACSTIAGGKTCAWPTDFDVLDITAENDEVDTCDKVGLISESMQADALGGKFAFKVKTHNSYADSYNCRGFQVVETDDLCYGWLVSSSGATPLDFFGKSCTVRDDVDDIYLSSTTPATCAAKHFSNPESYMGTSLGMTECYSSDEYTANGCMDEDTMDVYFKEYVDNQYNTDTNMNPYTTNSCAYSGSYLLEAGGQYDGPTYRGCCFSPFVSSCAAYTAAACPCGCLVDETNTCYDPLTQEIADLEGDSSYDAATDTNIFGLNRYCYYMDTEDCCTSFTDYSSSESVQPVLCRWDGSRPGRSKDYDMAATSKCTPLSTTIVEGTCANCACVTESQSSFKDYSNDLKCPHKENCYMPADDECANFNYGGFMSTWQGYFAGSVQSMWPTRWKPGATSCHKDSDANGYVLCYTIVLLFFLVCDVSVSLLSTYCFLSAFYATT
jgi:hypothetical protein